MRYYLLKFNKGFIFQAKPKVPFRSFVASNKISVCYGIPHIQYPSIFLEKEKQTIPLKSIIIFLGNENGICIVQFFNNEYNLNFLFKSVQQALKEWKKNHVSI